MTHRKCNQANCEAPATHFYVWTKPCYSCHEHAMKAVAIALAMGFPTPSHTLREMDEDEQYEDVDGE